MTAPAHETFHWEGCAEFLQSFAALPELELDPKHRCFASDSLRVIPPLVFPIRERCTSLASYLAELPDQPARHTVILMQAGAVSLGAFEGGEELSTKSFKRYVVRGKGRAQPSHLDAKGKSRYGSRLRLQNARRIIEETNEKLLEWHGEFGPADEVYYNCPVRLWPSLFAGKVKPPFEKTDALIRIPLDLPKPTTGLLLRTYRAMSYGRVEELRS